MTVPGIGWLWIVVFGAWIVVATVYHLVAQRRRRLEFEATMRKRFRRIQP